MKPLRQLSWTQLKYGNLIRSFSHGILSVNLVTNTHIRCFQRNPADLIELKWTAFTGVDFTDEILDKIGFTSNSGWWSFKDGSWPFFEILEQAHENGNVYQLTYDKTIISPPLQLHNLQNIYQELTWEALHVESLIPE